MHALQDLACAAERPLSVPQKYILLKTYHDKLWRLRRRLCVYPTFKGAAECYALAASSLEAHDRKRKKTELNLFPAHALPAAHAQPLGDQVRQLLQ
jgi:hypothetical protein